MSFTERYQQTDQKEVKLYLKEKDLETYGYLPRTEAKGERITERRSMKKKKKLIDNVFA